MAATTTPTPFSLARRSIWSRSAALKPVVPITRLTPRFMPVCAADSAAVATVKSIITSGRHRSMISSRLEENGTEAEVSGSCNCFCAVFTSTAPASCSPSSRQTALITSLPIFPNAPCTTTFIGSAAITLASCLNNAACLPWDVSVVAAASLAAG